MNNFSGALSIHNTLVKERKAQAFGLGITLERRLAERSSSTASENPVPTHQWMKISHQMTLD